MEFCMNKSFVNIFTLTVHYLWHQSNSAAVLNKKIKTFFLWQYAQDRLKLGCFTDLTWTISIDVSRYSVIRLAA